MTLNVMQSAMLKSGLVTKNRMKYFAKQEARKLAIEQLKKEVAVMEAKLKTGLSPERRCELLAAVKMHRELINAK